MVVKIFQQEEGMTNEIKMLLKLRKIKKKKYPEDKDLIPKLIDFGSLIVRNKDDHKELYFYQILPRYKQTLEESIEKWSDSNKCIDNFDVLDISI